ncbi:formate dehydrogenase subunit gamma [Oxalobacteraceae bacterium CAVE-383]|nr:formate dehydrogenase subunit gamma [Oxalobacteraceae bacterium CAVE-383]
MQAVLEDKRNPSGARPPKAQLDPETRDRVMAAIGRHKDLAGAMLPILHDIQDALGHVPAEAVPLVAEALNLSRAEVHGVISYYHHFRQTPAAANVLQICRAEACQARGADALVEHAKASLGCDFHGTSADGQFTLEPVYCLGLCSSGPNMMLGDDLHAQVSSAKFDRLVQSALAARKELP